MTPAHASSGGGLMKMLTSPPIIIAGAAIGAVLLIMGANKGGGSSSSSDAPGYGTAVLGATVQMNQAAMQAQTAQMQINANLGAEQYGQDTQRQANLLGFLANIGNTNAVLTGQIAEANAGITNNSITQSFGYATDVNNNMERLNEAYISANVAQAGDRSNVEIAGINAASAQAIANMQQQTAIFTTLIGAGTKLLTAPIGF